MVLYIQGPPKGPGNLGLYGQVVSIQRCFTIVEVRRYVVQQWSLRTGGLYSRLHCSRVDIVNSPIVVTQDRWSLCRGGL